jgi:hypothetical protein
MRAAMNSITSARSALTTNTRRSSSQRDSDIKSARYAAIVFFDSPCSIHTASKKRPIDGALLGGMPRGSDTNDFKAVPIVTFCLLLRGDITQTQRLLAAWKGQIKGGKPWPFQSITMATVSNGTSKLDVNHLTFIHSS